MTNLCEDYSLNILQVDVASCRHPTAAIFPTSAATTVYILYSSPALLVVVISDREIVRKLITTDGGSTRFLSTPTGCRHRDRSSTYRQLTATVSAIAAAPPSTTVASPTSTPSLSLPELSTRRSSSSCRSSVAPRFPVFLDTTAPSPDPDSPPTDSACCSRSVRSVILSTVSEEHPATGQTSLFCDICPHRAFQSSPSDSGRDPTTIRMSSDASFAPPPFKGLPSEDAERWLRRFTYYVDYRKLSDDEALQLFKLLLSDTAADWLESLNDTDRHSIRSISKCFTERFETSEICRWKQASEIFTRQQSPNETVDIFITDVLNLAKRVPIDDQKIIRFALLKGFKPAIRQHVLQSSADTLDATIKAARIAEAAAAHGPSEAADITGLAKDVRDLLAALADLKTKPRTPSAERLAFTDGGATSSTSRSSSPRRVSFGDRPSRPECRPSQHSSSVYRRPVVNTPMSWEWPDDVPCDDRYCRPAPPSFQRRPSWPPNSWRHSRPLSGTQQQYWSPSSNFSTDHHLSGQSLHYTSHVCSRCGRFHAINDCFARGLQCFQCGRFNHLKAMCRSAPAPVVQPNPIVEPNFSGNFPRKNFVKHRNFNP